MISFEFLIFINFNYFILYIIWQDTLRNEKDSAHGSSMSSEREYLILHWAVLTYWINADVASATSGSVMVTLHNILGDRFKPYALC